MQRAAPTLANGKADSSVGNKILAIALEAESDKL
jgi:hypothetical protein